MSPKTFIFIGRSGCGKGTQAALLEAYIKEKQPKIAVIHLETGLLFREFIKSSSATAKLSTENYLSGGLQPEFLTVHLWSNFFVKNYKGGENMIIDGTPRKLQEAYILDSAFKFYKREKPTVIYLNVSRKWSEEKLLARKRQDDTKADIKSRLDWFDVDVVPTIDFYIKNKDYTVLNIDAERPVEKIHEDIVKSCGI